MTRVITYTLTLAEPCLLTEPGGDPNTEKSMPYIPGGALRGSLAAAYLRSDHTPGDEFDDLFLSGRARYLNAYPLLTFEVPNGTAKKEYKSVRALPTPRAWTRLKDKDDERVYNRAEQIQFDAAGEEITSGISNPFVTFTAPITEAKPAFEIAVHTARNREMGRSIEGDADSALFRYQALARDQQFAGAIVLEDGVDPAQLKKLLTGFILIGGSQNAGYGRVHVGDVAIQENWREVANPPQDIAADGTFIVYLTSHAILYHPDTGQPTGDIRHFLPGDPDDYKCDKSFAASTWVGGFNKKRGLPLSQQWALQMGSAWVIRARKPLTAEQIAALEHTGIGARTEEGFGRLVFNPQWPQQAFEMKKYSASAGSEAQFQAPAKADEANKADKLAASAHPLLAQMNERIARAELDRRLAAKVNELAHRDNVRGHLSNSQLGRLQVRIRREIDKDNFADFLAYLDGTRKRKSADDQFRKFAVGGRNFRVFLEELAGKPSADENKQPATVWDFLEKGAPPLPSISSEPIMVRTKPLTHEYTVKFIANLCRQLSKLEVKS